MFALEEYLWGWIIYLLAAIGLLTVFWRVTQSIALIYLKQSLRLIIATLLLTPALIENTSWLWSPAWVQGLLQLIFVGMDGFLPVGRHLLIAVCAILIVYLLVLMGQQLYRFYIARRRSS